jgi:hypothetical protein
MSKVLLENETKGYKLWENDAGNLCIEVLCGGIGMYIAKIILSQEEVELFRERGEDYIQDLAYDIATDSHKYESRMRP